MSTRWMAVQYVGDTLRLPVVNESDMDKPFGSSMLEREVRRIVINPLFDTPQVFVPETEKAALEQRIDELCAEVEALKRDEWAAGFSAGCDAVEAAYEDGRPYYEVENAKLREYAAKAWSLFIRHGAVHPCDLSEVDAVRDGMRELGVGVGE